MAIILIPLTDSFNQWRVKTNSISLLVGDVDLLASDQTDIVGAVNENFSSIGTLASLTTTLKTNIVSAVNEIDSHTDVNTTSIGTLANLTTTAKNNIVSAINEVDGISDINNTNIGILASLTTTDKTSLVGAINEVKDATGNLTGDVTSIGKVTTLTNAPVIAKLLTGFTSGAGTISATDSILSAIQKLNGNDATNANLTGDVTSIGNVTTLTNAPVIAKVLTGFTSGAGTISASDSILSAIQKLNGNDALNATVAQATSAVVITGGSINNTTIGASTPSTGVFTTITLGGYTVGTLPAGTIGMKAYVTDATAPTYLGTLTGGGAVVCPVFYNGTAWVSA